MERRTEGREGEMGEMGRVGGRGRRRRDESRGHGKCRRKRKLNNIKCKISVTHTPSYILLRK